MMEIHPFIHPWPAASILVNSTERKGLVDLLWGCLSICLTGLDWTGSFLVVRSFVRTWGEVRSSRRVVVG